MFSARARQEAEHTEPRFATCSACSGFMNIKRVRPLARRRPTQDEGLPFRGLGFTRLKGDLLSPPPMPYLCPISPSFASLFYPLRSVFPLCLLAVTAENARMELYNCLWSLAAAVWSLLGFNSIRKVHFFFLLYLSAEFGKSNIKTVA